MLISSLQKWELYSTMCIFCPFCSDIFILQLVCFISITSSICVDNISITVLSVVCPRLKGNEFCWKLLPSQHIKKKNTGVKQLCVTQGGRETWGTLTATAQCSADTDEPAMRWCCQTSCKRVWRSSFTSSTSTSLWESHCVCTCVVALPAALGLCVST